MLTRILLFSLQTVPNWTRTTSTGKKRNHSQDIDDSKTTFPVHSNHNGFDAEKPATTIGTTGRSNSSYSNGGLNGGTNGHGPLPPDGMYHVTDMTGNGGGNNGSLLDPNGSLADKVSNSTPEEPASTSSSQANIIANLRHNGGGDGGSGYGRGGGQGHFYTNPASVHPQQQQQQIVGGGGGMPPAPPARMRLPSSTCV